MFSKDVSQCYFIYSVIVLTSWSGIDCALNGHKDLGYNRPYAIPLEIMRYVTAILQIWWTFLIFGTYGLGGIGTGVPLVTGEYGVGEYRDWEA